MATNDTTKLCDFTSTNNNDFICTPIAPPAATAESYEIKPALLNLVMKEQFSGIGEDAASHLNNFVELCDMQKYKEVDGDIVKLRLFPFSLRGRAKEWLLSLPKNSIDSWTKCKDAFIGKYYPPAKIIQLRSNIMNFRQNDTEHVAQAWERMKTMVKNCPTHGLTTWMVVQTFYAGLNFSSRNLLDSAAGGTFMNLTLGAANKLLDDLMTNYSQWHTERAPTGKKVNSVEEVSSSLSDKIDMLASLLAKQVPIDPNNVPLNSLVANENDQIDVNFIARNNFNNSAYKNNFGGNNYRPYPNNNDNSYGNSYGNAYSNPKSSSSDLENMLKEFISTQKVFNKTVDERLAKLDNLVLKVDSLAHDVEILKIRTTPLEAKKTEPINAIQVQINENIRMLAQIHARREREAEIAKKSAKSEPVKICTIQPFEEVKTFSTHEYPNASNILMSKQVGLERSIL